MKISLPTVPEPLTLGHLEIELIYLYLKPSIGETEEGRKLLNKIVAVNKEMLRYEAEMWVYNMLKELSEGEAFPADRGY